MLREYFEYFAKSLEVTQDHWKWHSWQILSVTYWRDLEI